MTLQWWQRLISSLLPQRSSAAYPAGDSAGPITSSLISEIFICTHDISSFPSRWSFLRLLFPDSCSCCSLPTNINVGKTNKNIFNFIQRRFKTALLCRWAAVTQKFFASALNTFMHFMHLHWCVFQVGLYFASRHWIAFHSARLMDTSQPQKVKIDVAASFENAVANLPSINDLTEIYLALRHGT